MKKASEYREHAEHWRQLSQKFFGEQREQLLKMAETWESLASDRRTLVERHPELSEGNGDEYP